jgi:hypothetical protein
MDAALTHDEFSRQVNTTFQVQTDPSVELELIEVSELKLHPQQEEFTIVFRGPGNAFLEQGIRSLTHEQMGQFEIFLVPIRQDEHGFYYEAVFNRIRE